MAHTSRPHLKVQQSSFRKLVANHADCHSIFNLLTSDDLLDQVEGLLPDHRERLFPPTETLSMFVAQVFSQDRSCQNIVNQAATKSLVSGRTPCSTHTGGYCKARQRLPLELPQELARFMGQSLEKEIPSSWRWHGRRVRVVDGTSITMPDTGANQSVYPQQGGQKPGLGFPISRLVAVTDLYSGAVLDVAFGRFAGKGSDEQSLLRLLSGLFESGDIILGDAFFPSYIFIAEMLEKGVDILMEQIGGRLRSVDFRLGTSLGKRDHVIKYTKPKEKPAWIDKARFEAIPDTIVVREFKAKGKIFVTTLIDSKIYSKHAVIALYKHRWEIETNIGQIKTILGMNILSCKTPEMIVKEIWVYILGYNIIRLLMAQSAAIISLRPTDLSFKHCLQLWLNYLQQTATLDEATTVLLLTLMAQQRVGNRPGRIEPRALKRRPKAYPMLMEPRAVARETVRKNGHPKKLK
jgi:hypothetical protein